MKNKKIFGHLINFMSFFGQLAPHMQTQQDVIIICDIYYNHNVTGDVFRCFLLF